MKIFIICGEKSGNETLHDILTYFFNCVKEQKIEENVEIKGVVNDECATKFNISQICNANYFSVIGFGDILFNLPSFFDKINDISYFIADYQPDLIISIDSYELSIRIAKKTRKLLKKRNIGYKDVQFWHIGAPSVWAYWKFRAKKIAKYYDKLFYFFPFEGQYFKPLEKHTNIYHKGFKSEFVGFNYAFQQLDHNIMKNDNYSTQYGNNNMVNNNNNMYYQYNRSNSNNMEQMNQANQMNMNYNNRSNTMPNLMKKDSINNQNKYEEMNVNFFQNNKKPQILYKYRDLGENTEKIFTDKKIWWSA